MRQDSLTCAKRIQEPCRALIQPHMCIGNRTLLCPRFIFFPGGMLRTPPRTSVRHLKHLEATTLPIEWVRICTLHKSSVTLVSVASTYSATTQRKPNHLQGNWSPLRLPLTDMPPYWDMLSPQPLLESNQRLWSQSPPPYHLVKGLWSVSRYTENGTYHF